MSDELAMKEVLEVVHECQGYLDQHRPQMAIDRLRLLLGTGQVPRAHIWRIYAALSTCYMTTLDAKRSTDFRWQAILAGGAMSLTQQQQLYSDYLFALHYLPDLSDEDFRERHLGYNQLAAPIVPYEHPRARHRHQKLRIGYLASLLNHNINSFFTIQPMTAYDRERYEVYLYGVIPGEEDELAKLLKTKVKSLKIFSEGTSPSQMAEEIYKDEIDILFDTTVHTHGGKTLPVMMRRPAPVQLAGIGYMSTSGLSAIDYYLTDVYVDPPGEHDEDFSEQLIRLTKSHFNYTPPERITIAKRRYEYHAPVTFGCFQNITKLNEQLLLTWKKILARVPGSTILIKNANNSIWNIRIIERRLKKLGFPRDSYRLEGPSADYFDRYMDVDIMLDTYPYVGGGSTCDALLRGVPVITRYGSRHGERFGLSLLTNIGHPELAAATEEEYIEKAVALAKDSKRIKRLHTTIPEEMRRSPVMDHLGYVRTLERVYEKIWQKWLLTGGKR